MTIRAGCRVAGILGGAALAASAGALAADPAPGPPAGATSCSGCHAPAGRVTSPSIPPLDGLRAADVARAMAEYRTGDRPGTVMGRIARGFTDTEAEAIGRWLEQQRR